MYEGDLPALLRHHASTNSVPGAAIGILRDGAATAAYHGVTDVTTLEPVTPETRFSVGSLTKSMVATVIARFAELGLLSLNDPVAAHVPELRRSGWAGRATLRDLLANRSGLPLHTDLEFGFDSRKDTDDGALSRLAADVGATLPTAGFWSYTNVGWCLLGRVIETTAGTRWEDGLRHHLFERAGMRKTTFANDAAAQQRVSGHKITAAGPIPVEPLVARAYGSAGASVVSTVSDLLRFAALHLTDPSLAALRAVQSETAIYGWLDSWGLGWARLNWRGGQVWGWDSVINGERSILRMLPQGGRTGTAVVRSGGRGTERFRVRRTTVSAHLRRAGENTGG